MITIWRRNPLIWFPANKVEWFLVETIKGNITVWSLRWNAEEPWSSILLSYWHLVDSIAKSARSTTKNGWISFYKSFRNRKRTSIEKLSSPNGQFSGPYWQSRNYFFSTCSFHRMGTLTFTISSLEKYTSMA